MMTGKVLRERLLLFRPLPLPSIQGNIGAAVNMNREARKYKSKHDYKKRANEQINKEKNNYDAYNEQVLAPILTQT